jgi:hypothetical protein
MAHFIVQTGIVECPACGIGLVKKREQDGRVHIMKHEGAEFCSLHNRLFRVDRLSGYGEECHDA